MATSFRKILSHLHTFLRIPILAIPVGLLACGTLWASDRDGDLHAAVPPGQEDRLAEALAPPDNLLPEGVELSGLQIERHFVRLFFEDHGKGGEFQLFPMATPADDACRKLQRLKLCSRKSFPPWTDAYLKWIASEGREARLAAAWTVVSEIETPRVERTRIPDLSAPITAGLGCLILASLFVFLRFYRKNAPPALSGPLAAGFPALATAFFTVRMLGDEAVAAATLVFAGAAMAFFPVGGDGRERYFPRLKARLRAFLQESLRSGLLPFLAVLLLIVLQLSGVFPPVNWILDPVLGFFARPWLADPGVRAGFVWGYFILLSLALSCAFVWVLKTDRREIRSLFPALSMGFLASLIPTLVWIVPADPAPGGVWLEYGPAFWLSDFSLPAVDYRLGGGFVGAIFLKTFAGTRGWMALNVFSALFCCIALAVTARLVFGSHKATLGAALLWALHPAHPAFLVEAWWFFLAAGWLALAVGTHVHAVRNASVPWLLLSLLCAQWAMETRAEGILILPMFFVIRTIWKAPDRHGKWVALFCIFNLLRLATAYQTESAFGAGVWRRNLLGYAEILESLAPWFLAALAAAWGSAGSRSREVGLLSAWLGGILAFYLLAATAPSQREGYLIALPAAILFGGWLAGKPGAEENDVGKARRWFHHPALRPVGALLLLLFAAWAGKNTRTHWMEEHERKTETARAARDLLNDLDRNTPLLVNPAWRRLAVPEQAGPDEKRRRPTMAELPNLYSEIPVLACLGTEMDGEPHCCYYEPGGVDRTDIRARGDCWPASLSGRDVRLAANRGRLRLYELHLAKETTP